MKPALARELGALRRRVAALEKGAARAAQSKAVLQAEAHALAERVKELNCLYAISALAEDREMTLEQVLQKTVEMLPPAWQYPERACARLTVRDQVFQTASFRKTRWRQVASVRENGRTIGTLEVCYRMPRGHSGQDPFLPEEQKLLKAIADRVSTVIELKSSESMLLAYQEQLRSLTLQLSLTAERERRDIAVNLHDTVGENLVVASLKLEALRKSNRGGENRRKLGEAVRILRETLAQTRQLAFELSPPVLYELGFAAAVEWLAERMSHEYGLEVRVQDDRKGGPPLSEEWRIVLFRAVRELLKNVAIHARASGARVRLSREKGRLEVRVEDDGVGFDASRALDSPTSYETFGLFTIRERIRHLGGRFEIDSRPGHGTTARLLLPLKEPRADGGAKK